MTLTLHVPPLSENLHITIPPARITREEYRNLCRENPELRIERTAEGEVIIMPPAHSRSGEQNVNLAIDLGIWARKDGRGLTFDSSTGFDLPNGANRSPDASWVLKSRLKQLTPEERAEYLPLCPDFVIELRSKSDRLPVLHAKMREYIESGARLGWLIDPIDRQAFIYSADAPPEHLLNPPVLDGGPILPGFILDLAAIWNPEI
jgi:Uma2 family endonuclease